MVHPEIAGKDAQVRDEWAQARLNLADARCDVLTADLAVAVARIDRLETLVNELQHAALLAHDTGGRSRPKFTPVTILPG